MSIVPENLDAHAVSLFLDVDGTLLDIRDDPSEVVADVELIETLSACFAKLEGALSLVSGRSIEEVDRIFAPSIFPVAGAHGAELRFDRDGAVKRLNAPFPGSAMHMLAAFSKERDGVLLERKRGGVSLHYRQAPQFEAECRSIVTEVLADLGDAFRLIAGKMVFEIAPSAHNKGAAICEFLEHTPFAGRVPVFVGDDVTDEDGFREVNRLAGVSIRVGGKDRSSAKFRLPDVASVRSWLREVLIGADQENRGVEER
jgi:trehalose 6-phosphate phosphatase